MRGKAIILGAVAVVAVATLTANAQNSTSRTATNASLAALVAATTRVAAEREQVALAAHATASAAATTQVASKTEVKTEVETEASAPKVTITADCQAAINHLKDMHKADVAEDAQERASLHPESDNATTVNTADQAEDTAEAQQWKTALLAAHTACVPQTTTACQAALASLRTLLQTLHPQESGEIDFRAEVKAQITSLSTDWSAVRTAFSAVQTACPEPH